MPTINMVRVLNQKTLPYGHETCGYHTFKNALLCLMRAQKKITDRQFHQMLNNPRLFTALFETTVEAANSQGNKDITISRFLQLTQKAKAGLLDFSAQGMSPDNLASLPLAIDGSQQLSVAHIIAQQGYSPEYALTGLEEDLFAAAMLAKLARNKGPLEHVFAIGINNQHWVTVSLTQNIKGQRTWKMMDSWHNQTLWQQAIVNKIEAVLTRNESQLNDYLLAAYTYASRVFQHRYQCFFNPFTGEVFSNRSKGWGPNNDQELNAKEFFVDDEDNRQEFLKYLSNRFVFMQTADWLNSEHDQVLMKVKQLYHVAYFILSHTDENDLKTQNLLEPICRNLKICLDRPLQEKPKPADLAHASPAEDDFFDDSFDAQVKSARASVNYMEPNPTESFFRRFVNAILHFFEIVKETFHDLASTMGFI